MLHIGFAFVFFPCYWSQIENTKLSEGFLLLLLGFYCICVLEEKFQVPHKVKIN